MTVPASIQDSVNRAQTAVRGALAGWNAADPEQCEKCCELLRLAVADLEIARRAAEERRITSCAALQRQLEGVRIDIRVLMRLLDASAAFARGLALRGPADDDASEGAHAALRTEVQA